MFLTPHAMLFMRLIFELNPSSMALFFLESKQFSISTAFRARSLVTDLIPITMLFTIPSVRFSRKEPLTVSIILRTKPAVRSEICSPI